ncbi:Hscb, partial [Acrasis kona]
MNRTIFRVCVMSPLRAHKKLSRSYSSICWNCEHNTTSLFCKSCSKVQPPTNKDNYFEALNVPAVYNVDVDQLEHEFKDLQKKLHPDKFTGASEEEQRYSAQQSSLVNNAYQTLKDPQLRATYMLENILHADVENLQLSKEFLMDMMELMEEIETDRSLTEDDFRRRKEQISQHKQHIFKNLSESFKSNNIADARYHVAELNYLSRIDNLINE